MLDASRYLFARARSDAVPAVARLCFEPFKTHHDENLEDEPYSTVT